MSVIVEFLPPLDASGEPVTLDEAKMNARWDADNTLLDPLIQNVLIPGARQLAETKTGSAIRPARYIQRLQEFPTQGAPIAITHGLVMDVESIAYLATDGASASLTSSDFDAEVIERETILAPVADAWPDTKRSLKAVEITYTAGISPADLAAKYPSVKQWILMAVAWGIEQSELFMLSKGRQGYQELPADYLAGMLDPITIRPRF